MMKTEQLQDCINACYECASICDQCLYSCLQETDVKKMARCIELDIYCADMCKLTARFLSMGDTFVEEICHLCAEICEECGKECANHSMEHCKRCAEACQKCAEECRTMIAA